MSFKIQQTPTSGSSDSFMRLINPIWNSNFVQKQLGYLQNTLIQQVSNSALQQSNPVINALLDTLQKLHSEVETSLKNCEAEEASVQNEFNTPVINLLETFLNNPGSYLKDARNEDHTFMRLDGTNEDAFRYVSVAANCNRYDVDDLRWIAQGIKFLEQAQKSQQGFISKALRSIQLPSKTEVGKEETGSLESFLVTLGLTNGATVDTQHLKNIEQARQTLIQQTTPSPVPILPPNNFPKELDKKLKNISNTISKMILCQLIFGDGKIFHKVYSRAQKKLLSDGNFDTLFFKELEDEFSTTEKPRSIFEQYRYSFHLSITNYLLKFYIDHIATRFKDDLVNFLNRSPEERVQDVFTTILGPVRAHMSAFYTFNQNLAGKTLSGTVDDANQDYFDTMDYGKGKNVDAILSELGNFIVERYCPHLSWTDAIDGYFGRLQSKIANLARWETVHACMTAIKVATVWTAYLLTGIFEWAMNRAIKFKLKNELKSLVKSTLFTTRSSEQKTHSLFQYHINQLIASKLRTLNATGVSHDHKITRLRSSPTTQQELQIFIDELSGLIPLSIATQNAQSLTDYFNPNTVRQGTQAAFKIFQGQFVPPVSLELLKGLEQLLYDDKQGHPLGPLSEFVWGAVNNLSKALVTDAQDVNSSQMAATETQMYEELHEAVKKIVNTAVDTALDPSKKYQNETSAHISSLKERVEGFLKACGELTTEQFSELDGKWQQLIQAVLEIHKQFNETGVKKIKDQGNKILQSFTDMQKSVTPILDEINKSKKDKSDVEQQLQWLTSVASSIAQWPASSKTRPLDILGDATTTTQELKDEIEKYKEFLKDFCATIPNEPVLKLEKAFELKFSKIIDAEKEKLLKKIKELDLIMNNGIDNFKQKIAVIEEWNGKLAPLPLSSEDVTSTLARSVKLLGINAEKYAAKAVMYCVLELISLKQKPYHWNQVLIRVMHALSS